MIYIEIDFSHKDFFIDEAKIKTLAESICSYLSLNDYELSIKIVDNKTIKELNKQFRNKNSATDVLSFPLIEWNKPLLVGDKKPEESIKEQQGHSTLLGDIVISLEQAQDNALSVQQNIDREFCFLIVHSVLHLCGHDHKELEQEKTMIAQQKQLMNLLENQNPPLWENCIKEST